MNLFQDIRGNQINLDLVAVFKPASGHGGPSYECRSDSGETLGYMHQRDLPHLPTVVVPDTRHTPLISFYSCVDANGHVTGVDHRRLPVLAWAFELVNGYWNTTPVCYDSFGDHWCLEQTDPQGKLSWVFPDEAHFDTFEEAKDFALAGLQARESQKQPA